MPISKYLKQLRERIGHDLLMLPSVAAIVKNESGHILFQKRSDDGTWSLPAGSIEPGETPAQAILREVWEETGLTVKIERVVGVFGGSDFTWTYPTKDIVQYTVLVFQCRVESGTLGGSDGESQDLVFFEPNAVPKLELPYPVELFHMTDQATLFN